MLLVQGPETYIDPESLEELPLVPGMSKTETMLRWGFIRKVYGIIAAQLLLTSAVVSVILFNESALQFSQTNVPFRVCFMIGPLLGEIAALLAQSCTLPFPKLKLVQSTL